MALGYSKKEITKIVAKLDSTKDVGTLALYGTAGIFVGIPKNK